MTLDVVGITIDPAGTTDLWVTARSDKAQISLKVPKEESPSINSKLIVTVVEDKGTTIVTPDGS